MKDFFYPQVNNFDYSKFNAEHGIVSSRNFKCNIDGIEKYFGMSDTEGEGKHGYVFRPVTITEIRVMQGKTRSGINVYYKYIAKDIWNHERKFEGHCNLHEIERESALRIIEYIKANI